jgi:hypothetical protein
MEKKYLARRDRVLKWLTIGIGIKRWVLFTLLGLVLAAVGASLTAAFVAVDLSLLVMEWISAKTHTLLDSVALGIALLIAGVLLVAVGLRGTMKAVERAFSNGNDKGDLLKPPTAAVSSNTASVW